MHFTVTRSINPICNCKSASLTKEGLLTSFNSKLYLTDLETMSNKLIATLDSDISNSYLIDGNLFISCKNSIFINNLKINFHKKIFFFNVINNFLVVSFHNSTYIFKYKMHKIHSPYFNCKIESPIILDYSFIDNEKINDYLEIVCKYDFVTLSSCYNDKLILGDVNGKLHFINLENKKILSEDKSDSGIKLVDFFKNDLFILDEKNNLIKNNKIIKKNVIGFSVKEEKLVIGKEYKLVDYESKKNICEFRSRLVYFGKNVGITDEFEILVEEKLLVGNNDEITDLCFVQNSENKLSSNFEAENFKNKKMCIKQNQQDSLLIATNSGRLRIFENGMYKLFYDHEDSILSLAKNDDFLFTCSRDESLCVYFQGNLILKVTDINLLSIVLVNDDLFGVGGTNIFHFKIESNKNLANFLQTSFTKINDTFLKLVKSESVNKEINYLTGNNKFLSICFDKQINVYDHKLNLLQSKSLNKKINVIAMSDKYLFSGNKTFRVHNLNTLEVLYSLEINIPLVSMCVYNENVLLGDANGWLYSVKDDKILFKKQIHKDRIWCIKQIQSNNQNFLVTGSADGSINFLINDTEEYNERKTEEERINKQIKLDIKVLRDNKDYPTLLEKMITNNLPGIEKELLNYFYTNNKSLDKNTINLLKNTTLNHKKMNLKYLELINYLSNQINLQIKDSLIEGMDELFKELIKNKNK